MKKKLVIMITAASLLLSACNGGKVKVDPAESTKPSSAQTEVTPVKVEKPKFTKDTYPKLDGSTATIPLSEAAASEVLGISKEDSQKFIKHNTTHNAYVNLINKKADIIFVTEPSEEELKLAKDAKIELEIIPVVNEGFVFLVNTKNPINSLTTKQIQDIYQGKVKNWKEVGGSGSEIIPYQREANSGSQTGMEKTVMKGLKMVDAPKTIVTGMEGLIESIAKYDNSERALGYSYFYYAKTMYNKDTIKFIGVDGVVPDNNTISSGKYPFTTSYYAVLRKSEPKYSSSRKLLDWMLSEDGQKLAEKTGYVPLKVR
jgi:phosphate transport system substrate-binding protein